MPDQQEPATPSVQALDRQQTFPRRLDWVESAAAFLLIIGGVIALPQAAESGPFGRLACVWCLPCAALLCMRTYFRQRAERWRSTEWYWCYVIIYVALVLSTIVLLPPDEPSRCTDEICLSRAQRVGLFWLWTAPANGLAILLGLMVTGKWSKAPAWRSGARGFTAMLVSYLLLVAGLRLT